VHWLLGFDEQNYPNCDLGLMSCVAAEQEVLHALKAHLHLVGVNEIDR